MMRANKSTPTFKGLKSASAKASRLARSSSRKKNTKCEIALRKALWKRGLRYRVSVDALTGCPDIVLSKSKVAIFCDGDFWHGRHLSKRLARLSQGHNSAYWVAKIERNVARDKQRVQELRRDGWLVLRFWETDIAREPERIAEEVERAVLRRSRD